jgi:two-component system KDP operon response regulator KdpE
MCLRDFEKMGVGRVTSGPGQRDGLHEAAMATHRRRVLIVEDHQHTLVLLARLFGLHGWAVVAAETATNGLAALTSQPDCVILDLNLPDAPGEAILGAIHERGLQVKVVAVITASADTGRLSHAAIYRPSLMIMKPFDWEVLLRYCESEVSGSPR